MFTFLATILSRHLFTIWSSFWKNRANTGFCERTPGSSFVRERTEKSGNESEMVFIPGRIADRLRKYIRDKGIQAGQRVFPITYAAARLVVKKAGKQAGIELRPHDLRRHAATYASRSGVPIEIVSKVILRHANLSTTQRYLGKISDTEATRWIENLYG